MILDREIDSTTKSWLRRVNLFRNLTNIVLGDVHYPRHLSQLFRDLIARLRLANDALLPAPEPQPPPAAPPGHPGAPDSPPVSDPAPPSAPDSPPPPGQPDVIDPQPQPDPPTPQI